jgi:hypothetical protein
MELTNFNSQQKFSSLFLVEQINIFRKEESKNELRHSDFLRKIEKEFDEEIIERNISFNEYKDSIGRSLKMYELTFVQASQILMSESKSVRKRVAKVLEQRQNLELVTVKEAAFAVKVINCLKYVDNQVKAYEMHRNTFVSEHAPSQYIYSEFAKYRSRLVGWDKEKVNEAVKTYIKNNIRYTDAKILKSNMQTQLSAIDPTEAIKIAVLDILYAKCTDTELAENFAKLCKNLANELEILPEKSNTNNLYRQSESIDSINKLELPNQL